MKLVSFIVTWLSSFWRYPSYEHQYEHRNRNLMPYNIESLKIIQAKPTDFSTRAIKDPAIQAGEDRVFRIKI